MPRSKHTGDASSGRTTVREEGDLLLVESPTAEEALDRLSSLLGPDVQIVAAGKVARGGVGGFFAKEMVQLSARSPSHPVPAPPAPPAAPAATPPTGLAESAMASLLNGSGRPTAAPRRSQPEAPSLDVAEEIPAHLRALLSERMGEAAGEPAAPAALPEEEPTFGEALRRQLGIDPPTPPSTGPEPPSTGPEPPSTGPEPPSTGPEPAGGLVPEAPQLTAAGPRSSTPPHLTVLDASWGAPLLDDPLAQDGLEVPAEAEPAVLLFDPVREPEPELGPALSSSGPGDPPGTGGVAWSADELARLGLPFSFIRPLLHLDPGDDLAWIRGLAVSVHPLCRPLPAGDVALVGSLAGHLAKPLRLEALRRPERGPKRGSICCSMMDDAESRRWFERVRRDRWIHLVVGVPDTRAFLDLHPRAVSCVGAGALAGALRLASELGVPLGYSKPDEAGPALRATPIEVALAVRALVVRR
jgi:hypothetical protein